MATFVTLFPVGSESGGETKAGPLIWEDEEGFEALVADFVTKAEAARLAAMQGQDQFALAWQTVSEACQACHTVFAPASDFQ